MAQEQATAVSWKIKPMPAQHKTLALDGAFFATEMQQIMFGFIPRDMDDKWFIYWQEGWLHFHRSWTGSCIYQLKIDPYKDDYRAVQAVVNRNPEEYRGKDDAYDVSVISFLIDRILLGKFAVFPQLPGLTAPDQSRHQQLMVGDKENGTNSIRLQMVNGRFSPQTPSL